MFLAGWVHRDISSGNVLCFDFGGKIGKRGKLADLEYAKKFEPNSMGSSDPKTVRICYLCSKIPDADDNTGHGVLHGRGSPDAGSFLHSSRGGFGSHAQRLRQSPDSPGHRSPRYAQL